MSGIAINKKDVVKRSSQKILERLAVMPGLTDMRKAQNIKEVDARKMFNLHWLNYKIKLRQMGKKHRPVKFASPWTHF